MLRRKPEPSTYLITLRNSSSSNFCHKYLISFQHIIGVYDSCFGCVYHHSGARPAHHLTYGFALLWGVAVNGASLANRFLLAKSAVVQSLARIVGQMLVFFCHCFLMQMMATIQLNHLSYGLLFSFNFTHVCSFLLSLIHNSY